jgi:thymidylate synthase
MKTRAEMYLVFKLRVTLRHNFSNGFPALSAKQLPYKFVKGELIWFLRGDTHIKYLLDNGILYGTKMPTTFMSK